MIKLFRKIRQKLLDDGNLKRYLLYALGEILLVVIGILIALQVNNWNQARLYKSKEALLLKEIHTEFKYNKAEMEITRKFYAKIKEDTKQIISFFPIHPDKIDLDSLAIYLEEIEFNPSFDLSTGSIASLKNNSSFDIISNEELRTLLLRFEDLFQDYQDRESRSKNFSFDYLDPYLKLRIPSPFHQGIKDTRVDLSFLASIEFENLLKDRLQKVQNFSQILEDSERPLVESIDRIIELSAPD